MNDSEPLTFALIDQPWLVVRRSDGTTDELGLTEVFRQSHELAGLAGELPTQVFALTRLLLAVLHQAIAGPRDPSHWAELWKADTLPTAAIEDHLARHRDRFDLFDPVAPFFQVAGLRTAKNEVSALTKIIADVPNGAQFFTTRRGRGTETVSFAEAARWLVHCQAFDPSGIKSGAVGDPRVKGGKGYPIGVGWSGLLGGVLVEGSTLRETLLLNLIARDDDRLARWADTDRAVWERAPAGPGEEVGGGRIPLGPVDLFTWQSRRIRLAHNGDRITGVLIGNGDKLLSQNMHTVEPHTAWRRSTPQEKKLKQPLVYMPREHTVERAVWRGLSALLPGVAGSQRGEGAVSIPPVVLDWIALLQDEHLIAVDFPVSIRTTGMVYGPQSSVVEEILDDRLPVHAVLLGRTSAELAAAAVECAQVADACAMALAGLAASITEAAGGEYAGPRERALESAYAEFDLPFRAWLSGLDSGTDAVAARTSWHRQAHRIVRDLARARVEQAPPTAWTGRIVKGHLLTVAHAEARFHRELARATPLAQLTRSIEEEESHD